ncbi:MAG: DUF2863 family protein [Oxalobacter sp.]
MMPNIARQTTQKISADSKRLAALAMEMFYASSFTESEFARLRLQALASSLIKRNRQAVLNQAGEYLFNTDMEAYNCLLEVVESYCESAVVVEKRHRSQFLFVAVPLLVWTRYSIPSGELDTAVYQALQAHFNRIMLAEGVRMSLSPILYTVDRMPMEPVEVYKASRQFIESIKTGEPCILPSKQEIVPFMADSRYLLAGIMADEGSPIFSWQEDPDPTDLENRKEKALLHWKEAVLPLMTQVLPGCHLDCLLPGGFFNTCRKTDQEIRPATVRAAVQYLESALGIPAQALGAVIGGFGKDSSGIQVEEYRISFYNLKDRKIVYGVVWPIYGIEEIDGPSLPVLLENHPSSTKVKGGVQLLAIFKLLRQLSVRFEKTPIERFIMEYCEDCGAPLFVDTQGELVHAEMPEEAQKDIRLH